MPQIPNPTFPTFQITETPQISNPIFQIDPVALNGAFRAFSPHSNCADPKIALSHYVKDIYQREFMETYKKIGTFCDEEHIKQWKLDHPKKPKKKKT